MRFYLTSIVAALALSLNPALAEGPRFISARPVWPEGRDREMNLLVGFRAAVQIPSGKSAVLRVAGSTIYRAWLNGRFLGYGPARGPHGHYRVDEWPLNPVAPGDNLVALEVAGYNCNSYYLLDQPSFLQAEVVAGETVLAATGEKSLSEKGDKPLEAKGVSPLFRTDSEIHPFRATILPHRLQKVQRYSFQRPFIEVYRLTPQSFRWRDDISFKGEAVALSVLPAKPLLARRVPLPEFNKILAQRYLGSSRVEKLAQVKNLWKDRSLVNIGPQLKGYPENQLITVPSTEMQSYRSIPGTPERQPYNAATPLPLEKGQDHLLDFGENDTGFLGATVTCRQNCRLWFLFDEILSNNDVDFKRLGCVNIVSYDLAPGTYRLESLEPYTLRYLKLLCLEGACTVRDVFLREYVHPTPKGAAFAASDERLNRLFKAGLTTFQQNALDVFMDCPSRERAGWLCDSFFTARVAADLNGTLPIEHNLYENYLLPARFAHLPEGMLPMCYPADHNDGIFIPNWALWFVVQLEEFARRGGDPTLVESLKPRVLRLLEFFKKYENDQGLLEKLPSWVFVEWSAANQFVQDVNYPSNMLFAGTLEAAGRLYKQPNLIRQAQAVRDLIRTQSFDGRFFVDNAVRRNGRLERTTNRTEVCQYFAFFFKVATPESHQELWQTLRDRFGPDRTKNKAFPEIHAANSFIGNMLRMELLSQAGRAQQILDESIAYLLYMAEGTGTLWENVGAEASCNHGFASHIVHTLYRDVLGLYEVNRVDKQVRVRFNPVRLDWCEGTLMTPQGPVHLRWWNEGKDRRAYRLTVPKGYRIAIDNLSGRTLNPRR